jgi:hypothetical protein
MCNKIIRLKSFYHIPTQAINYSNNNGLKGASASISTNKSKSKLKLNPIPYLDPILSHNIRPKQQQLQLQQIQLQVTISETREDFYEKNLRKYYGGHVTISIEVDVP